jgi:hypothetical protein
VLTLHLWLRLALLLEMVTLWALSLVLQVVLWLA